MMSEPKVSIGLPVFNGENYLAAAVDSILSQSFGDFELIIADNASEDGTQEICRRFAERDKRVRYSRAQVNQGAARNYRLVFEKARGKYFKWATHDDIHLPGFLERCVEVSDGAPASVVLVYPRTEVIDAQGRVTRKSEDSLDARHPRPHRRLAHVLRNLNMACEQCGLCRKEVLCKTRLIDAFIFSDYVLLAELAMLGEIWEIPEVLFQRRVHSGISTMANRNWGELLAWFDPSKQRSRIPISPFMSLGVEFLGSIRRLPLTTQDRALCWVTALFVWYVRQFRNLGGEYKIKLKRALGLQPQVV